MSEKLSIEEQGWFDGALEEADRRNVSEGKAGALMREMHALRKAKLHGKELEVYTEALERGRAAMGGTPERGARPRAEEVSARPALQTRPAGPSVSPEEWNEHLDRAERTQGLPEGFYRRRRLLRPGGPSPLGISPDRFGPDRSSGHSPDRGYLNGDEPGRLGSRRIYEPGQGPVGAEHWQQSLGGPGIPRPRTPH